MKVKGDEPPLPGYTNADALKWCIDSICVRSKLYIFETIPIVVAATWITQIAVIFVLPEQCVCWWTSGTLRLGNHGASEQHQNEQY